MKRTRIGLLCASLLFLSSSYSVDNQPEAVTRNTHIDDDAVIDGAFTVLGVSLLKNKLILQSEHNHSTLIEQLRFEKAMEFGVSNGVYGSIKFGNIDPILGGERGTMTINVSPSWEAEPTEAISIHGGNPHEITISGNTRMVGHQHLVGPYAVDTVLAEHIRFEKPLSQGASNPVYGSINFGNVDATLGGERGTLSINVSPSFAAEPTEALRIHGGAPHEVIIVGNGIIAGDLTTATPVKMGPAAQQTTAAGSFGTATRIEWTRVDADGTLLDHSNGVQSVNKLGAGLYEITFVPGLVITPAVIISTEEPQITGNAWVTSSDASTTVVVATTNGIDAAFDLAVFGLQ